MPLLPTYVGTSSADDGECESNKTAEVNHAPFVAARLVYAMKENTSIEGPVINLLYYDIS